MKQLKFSLIEILVVVAIIGILSSLLLPSLGKAREKAKLAVCKNNLKQIAIFFELNADDNEGRFPESTSHQWPGYGPVSWDDNLGDYDGRNLSDTQKNAGKLNGSDFNNDSGIYQCPTDDVVRLFGTDADCLPLTYSASSFFDNNGISNNSRGIIGVTWVGRMPYAIKFNEISKPSNTIALAELMREGQMVGRYWGSGVNADTMNSTPEIIPHDGVTGSNYLYTDGHVSKVSFFKTITKPDGSIASTSNITGTQWDAQ
ncbi:prepilin-type N-terminal cleavage/methylation domain-containing protein [Lentisphaera marina]|uniref:prepilin-type N-terminal cleavage/methylation domain-containing protein n=1 Tax=Lentisphaera marina TaxID=1111041 RepID=UPI0023658F41|nr:prepilin-type N-terminal cleavage/methylation domain-containing protein [Lentisphaera marina]MDD7983571.1 prepilin-type N-terminal cleavage/methylation domain-containing protein [Lentisphaera marina]